MAEKDHPVGSKEWAHNHAFGDEARDLYHQRFTDALSSDDIHVTIEETKELLENATVFQFFRELTLNALKEKSLRRFRETSLDNPSLQ